MNQKADRYLDAALQLAGKVGTLPASELGQAAQPALLALQARHLDVETWLHHLCEWYNQQGLAKVSVHRSEAGLPLVERTAAIAFLASADECLATFATMAKQNNIEVLVQPSGDILTVLIIGTVAFKLEQINWFEHYKHECAIWGVRAALFAKEGLAGKVSLSFSMVSAQEIAPGGLGQQVVLAHHSVIFMESLAGVLENQNYSVVGMATTLGQLRQLLRQLRPAVLILEPELNGEPTFDFAARTYADLPGSMVVYLTNLGDPSLIRRAAEAGARAYLRNDISVADLLAALDALPNHQFQISPAFASEYVLGQRADQDQPKRLTLLQSQIYEFTQQRLTNKEIATRLNISESNVKYHLRQILLALSLTKKGDLRK